METGTPKEDRGKLPEEEARRAIPFVNCVFRAFAKDWREKAKTMPRDVFETWKNRTVSGCVAFFLGVKPAIFVDRLQDVESVQKFLDESGKNAFIHQNSFIVDRDQVTRRIQEESDFARELGWQAGMTVDEWLQRANPGGDGGQRGIVGFFLGYPRSAVTAYANKRISEPYGVEIGDTFVFTTDAELAEADDVKALAEKTRTAFEKAGLGQFFRDKNGS